jgi:hypothetical protein
MIIQATRSTQTFTDSSHVLDGTQQEKRCRSQPSLKTFCCTRQPLRALQTGFTLSKILRTASEKTANANDTKI